MPIYFTNNEPKKGSWLYRDSNYDGAIGVLDSLNNHMPIGKAPGKGGRDDRVATWKLTVRGAELSGLWIVVNREFRPAG